MQIFQSIKKNPHLINVLKATFKEVFGIPAIASKWFLKEVLRKQCKCKGFKLTDDAGIVARNEHASDDFQTVSALPLKVGIEMNRVC